MLHGLLLGLGQFCFQEISQATSILVFHVRGRRRLGVADDVGVQAHDHSVLLQMDFIFSGDQFSGFSVRRCLELIILRNSSAGSWRLPGIMRMPSGVFLKVTTFPISSLISAGMQILPFESTLAVAPLTCSIFPHYKVG